LRIFVSVEHLAMEHEMAHYLTSDGKYRGSPYADEGELSLRGYRFGRGRGKYRRGRSALIRANSYLKNLIHSIADAKLRRMRRELERGGIRLDGPDEAWIANSLRNDDRNK
jgi:hypothetical protein